MAQQSIGIGTVANDGTGDPVRTAGTKINANFTELYGFVSSAVPQFEVTAGQTLALTRATHQGATIILSGAGASVSFSASTQGNGFVFTLKNRTGSAWTVPTFAGATREYAKAAAHTTVESAGDASFETYTRNSTMYVSVLGDTA